MKSRYRGIQKKRESLISLNGKMKQVGEEFREVRQLLCISREQVADEANLSEKTVSRLENGENMSMLTCFLIVGYYLNYAESKATIFNFMSLLFKRLEEREK